MNEKLKEYIDGIIIPSEIFQKRIKTGENIRKICNYIESAVKEYYGDKALVEYPILDMSCIDSESIYFFNCVEPTKTKGGYFGTVYLYMKDDFEDPDVYSTKIEILFSETAPDIDAYEIWDSYAWDSDTSRVVITVEPDHVNVDYTPEDDARHFPVMTEDVDRIKSFVETLISHFILEYGVVNMNRFCDENPKRMLIKFGKMKAIVSDWIRETFNTQPTIRTHGPYDMINFLIQREDIKISMDIVVNEVDKTTKDSFNYKQRVLVPHYVIPEESYVVISRVWMAITDMHTKKRKQHNIMTSVNIGGDKMILSPDYTIDIDEKYIKNKDFDKLKSYLEKASVWRKFNNGYK